MQSGLALLSFGWVPFALLKRQESLGTSGTNVPNFSWRRGPGSNRRIKVLQTLAYHLATAPLTFMIPQQVLMG